MNRLAALLLAASVHVGLLTQTAAASDTILPFAGGGAAYGDAGPALNANLLNPQGIVADAAGNLFIADGGHLTIRRVDAVSGIITTYAGINGAFGFSGDGGPAAAATLSGPLGLSVDAAGNLYLADASNSRIRRVNAATGIITTVAGNGDFGYYGDGGPALAAALFVPQGVASDSAGNIYIADTGNFAVRRVDAATGTITTIAGGIGGYSGDGGPAISAGLSDPRRIVVDPAGNVFILDRDISSRIRRIDATTHIITTIAGGGVGTGESGLAVNANLGEHCADLSVDAGGHVYIAGEKRVWVVTLSDGTIRVLAGTGAFGNSGNTGDAQAATFSELGGVTISPAGRIYVADSGAGRVRRVRTKIQIDAFAGGGASYGDGGPALNAQLDFPEGIAIDADGNIFLADNGHSTIRRVDAATGIITTYAGVNGLLDYLGDGGPATAAGIGLPLGIALDSAGNLFLADSLNSCIRRVSAATGTITTIAGDGNYGYGGDGGQGVGATLALPQGVAADATGHLYIADSDNAVIRQVNLATGMITRFAGLAPPLNTGQSGDGGPALNARFNNPIRVAVDAAGNVYVLDRTGNSRIRRIDAATHIITTFAGGGAGTGESGPAVSANLGLPTDICVDTAGHLLIAGQRRVWEVTLATGMIRVVAGTGASGNSGDTADASAATFSLLGGIAVSPVLGDLLIADEGANRVRRVRSAVLVNAATTQAYLDGLSALDGGLRMANIGDRPTLLVPALASLEGNLDAFGNTALTTLSAPLLGRIGGSMAISNNTVLGQVALPGLTRAGVDVNINNNNSADTINLGGLQNTGGDLNINNNNSADTVNLGGLQNTGGSVTISNQPHLNQVALPSLLHVGGSLSITNNIAATSIAAPAVTSTGGDFVVSDNGSVDYVQAGALQSTGGSFVVSNNGSVDYIQADALQSTGGSFVVSNNESVDYVQAGALQSTGGSFVVSNNGSADYVQAGALQSTGGDLTVTNNPSVTSVDFPALTAVTGNLTVETPIQSTVDFAGVAVGGNIDVSSTNATSVAVDAPGGTTSVEMTNGAASVDADLPDDAAPAGTPFAVLHVSGAGLDPQAGLDETGAPASVDPVAAYAFTLGGTLAAPASLVFEVILANLSPAEQAAVLDAYTAGKLTLTVQSDAPGSMPQARGQCGPADPLVADGCVKVAAFDALGFELAPGVTAGAAKLRIAALVSHFSTYAVSIITPNPTGGCPQAGCDSGGVDVDFDNDCRVTLTDLSTLLANFGTTGTPNRPGDANGNGDIDLTDLSLLLSRFGNECQ